MTFVLHREVLVESSPWWNALLSERWHKSTKFVKREGEEVAIWEVNLFFDHHEHTAELRIVVREITSQAWDEDGWQRLLDEEEVEKEMATIAGIGW